MHFKNMIHVQMKNYKNKKQLFFLKKTYGSYLKVWMKMSLRIWSWKNGFVFVYATQTNM